MTTTTRTITAAILLMLAVFTVGCLAGTTYTSTSTSQPTDTTAQWCAPGRTTWVCVPANPSGNGLTGEAVTIDGTTVALTTDGDGTVHEDDPRWDCLAMGNHQCGPGTPHHTEAQCHGDEVLTLQGCLPLPTPAPLAGTRWAN